MELPNLAEGRSLVGRTVGEVERILILDTLGHYAGNRTHAANVLGISIRTLRNKLHAYAASGLPIPPSGSQMGRSRDAECRRVVNAPDQHGGSPACGPPLSLIAHAPD
jgi:hypothetical protein